MTAMKLNAISTKKNHLQNIAGDDSTHCRQNDFHIIDGFYIQIFMLYIRDISQLRKAVTIQIM